jgi:hypothetical protein
VTGQPRAFFTLDFGSTTTAVAVIGHVGGRWRLVAHSAVPVYVDVDATLERLLTGIAATDPEMLAALCAGQDVDIPAIVATWPRLTAATTPERRIAVIAGSRRQRRRLETAALRAGWIVVGGSADEDDPVALSRLMLSTRTGAVLLGADHVPGGDEKRHLPDLAALVAAATRLRPELTVVLAGGAAVFESEFVAVMETNDAVEPSDADFDDGEAPVPEPSAAEAPPQKKLSRKAAAALEAASESTGPKKDAATEPESHAAAAATAGAATPAPEPEPAALALASESEAGGTVAAAEPEPAISSPVPDKPGQMPLGFRVAGGSSLATHLLLAPDAEAGQLPGDALQEVLEGLRALPNDSRLGVARSIASLAYVLDRSIEVVEIGMQGGLVARSDPFGQGRFMVASSRAGLTTGSFAPENPSEEVIDGVLSWSTIALDRHRAMDRLNDMRLQPWGESDGDGAIFRLAAAKAAFGRLVEAMPELAAHPMPELMVAAGGIFSSLPPSVVALALADLVRRPGVCQLTIDQARLLGPLGAIQDETERRQLLANLADDILVPLGGLILPAGVKPGKTAGFLRLKAASGVSEIELHPGAIQVVDLAPGRAARADIDFRDSVRLGKRAHHFTVDVGGGLSGLLVDLRDVPMRISERPDSRRSALETWQRGMWPEVDE